MMSVPPNYLHCSLLAGDNSDYRQDFFVVVVGRNKKNTHSGAK